MFAIGIDMSKLTFHAAFDEYEVQKYDNTEPGFASFIADLAKRGWPHLETKIGVESTGTYHLPFCMQLTKQGWSVVVLNPLAVNRIAKARLRPTKTDKIDAVIIRSVALLGEGYVFNDSIDRLQLKALISERSALVKIRAGIKQRINAETFRSTSAPSYERVLTNVTREIKRIEAQLPKYQAPTQQLLRSIPGVGLTSAAALVGLVGDIHRFSSPEKFTAYLGLDCRVKESGTSIQGKGYLTKRGNRYLRFVLFNAALIAKRYIPALKMFYQKKKHEGHHHFSAMCATERKLVRIIYAVWKRGAPFQTIPPTTTQPG